MTTLQIFNTVIILIGILMAAVFFWALTRWLKITKVDRKNARIAKRAKNKLLTNKYYRHA